MKRLLVLSIIAMLLFSLPSAVFAAKPPGEQERLNDALVLAADLHLSRQGTYSGVAHTWEWVIGSGLGYWNVVGISATGLLSAYERTGDSDYLDGALATGDALIAHYDSITDRPYSQDVEFLVRLAVNSDDSAYAEKAADYYSRMTSAFTAEENADRYINARKSLAGWDLASQIRAALAVGETDYAAGMAARLVERRADWEGVVYSSWDYTIDSYVSLLWAFAELGNKSFNSFVGEMREAILNVQEADGSWADGDYQTTAYAILGLTADGTAKGAQAKAWAFLRDTQTEIGGWYYEGYGELGEVNSEVIMALGSLDLKGLKAGHTDPNPDRGNDTGKHKIDPAP